MDQKSIALLEKLSNSFGPSGFERDPIQIIHQQVKNFCDTVYQDKLGSLLFEKKGTENLPVILLPGHVDEIGFVVSGIHEKGFLTFFTLGGWFDQTLLGQRVTVRGRDRDVPGVISVKPPHLLSPDERNKVIKKDKMFIDVGCTNKKEVEALGIRVGDPAIPASLFSIIKRKSFEDKNGKFIENNEVELAFGKAFDDRVGAFMAAEVIKRLYEDKTAHPNTVIGAATVQEEVGLRGARTAGWVTEPDVCITLEVDISGDIPGIEPPQAPASMGKGPSILTYDASLIPNPALRDLIISTAEKNKIPYQLSHVSGGGTDAGAVHTIRAGCPSIVLGIPTRHIHSHVGILCLKDIDNGISLLIEIIKLLDRDRVDGFTRIF